MRKAASMCLLLGGLLGCVNRAEFSDHGVPSPGNTGNPNNGGNANTLGNPNTGTGGNPNTGTGGNPNTTAGLNPNYFGLAGAAVALGVGESSGVTVTAYTAQGNVATTYTGVVTFSSSDNAATLAGPYTFTASDAGTHSFAKAITVQTVGSQSLTATDANGLTGSEPNIVVTPYVVMSVSTGADNDSVCALFNNQQIKCWGYNPNGQLGYGDTITRGSSLGQMGNALPFVSVDATYTVSDVCANGGDDVDGHTCAVLSSGDVKCWGANGNGQLGYGDTKSRLRPEPSAVVPLPGGLTAKNVRCGFDFSCATLSDSNVVCWGANNDGQLGVGDYNDRYSPGALVKIAAGRAIVDAQAGSEHICAILDDGNVTCWGLNSNGELGLGDTSLRNNPAVLPELSLGAQRTAIEIAPAAIHTCALRDDHQLMCWGDNTYGELGVGDTNQRTVPAGPLTFPGGVSIAGVAAGGANSTCVRSTAGKVYCWGRGDLGQLGLENPNLLLVPGGPLNLGTGRTATSVVIANYNGCALLDNKTTKCWGAYYSGTLGLGDSITRGASPGTMGDALPPTPLW